MANTGALDSADGRRHHRLRRSLCCSFAGPTWSPDRPGSQRPPPLLGRGPTGPPPKSHCPVSHSPSSRLGLGIMDPRLRIRSPGRVSPIDSVSPSEPPPDLARCSLEPDRPDPAPKEGSLASGNRAMEDGVYFGERSLDLRLVLMGKDGRFFVLEMDPAVLCENSSFFAAKLLDSGRKLSGEGADCWKLEIAGLENVDAYKETIELMYEIDAVRWLAESGVSRAIDILEVSSTIIFDRGIRACLKYIEAVPWNENEEEKLRSLFAQGRFEEATQEHMLSRLGSKDWDNSEDLVMLPMRLIQSVTDATNRKAKREMQSLVTGLLSSSSIYNKELAGLDKDKLYDICRSCLNSLILIFEEASDYITSQESKPLIERVSKQVENLNWLLEILIEKEMAEDFVHLWANQDDLILMRGRASPLMRYELSRISASIFVALGKRRVQCHSDHRLAVLSAWFAPLLVDFGWLQRCSKGLDTRLLEESLGQTILTLPLKEQQHFLEGWFGHFAEHGTECPDLGRAFQVWWRRLFRKRSSVACR